jgi:hypothetical protein
MHHMVMLEVYVINHAGSTQQPEGYIPYLPHFKPKRIISTDHFRGLVDSNLITPSITSLIIKHTGGIWDDTSLISLSRELTNVRTSLRSLEIGTLLPRESSRTFIRHIGDLHALRRLRIRMTDGSALSWFDEPDFSWSEDVEAFQQDHHLLPKSLPNINELDIEAPIPIVIAFLSIVGPKLQKLRIMGAPFDSAENVASMFKQMSLSVWSQGVTHFHYSISPRWSCHRTWSENWADWGLSRRLEIRDVTMTSQQLEPLLRLSSLSHLALCFHYAPAIDDAFLSTLAARMPGIQTLVISGRVQNNGEHPLTTLHGLDALSRLSHLSSLQLSFTCQLEGFTSQHPLTSLTRINISGSYLEGAPQETAPLLPALLPHLKKVYLNAPSVVHSEDGLAEDERSERWKAVWNSWTTPRHPPDSSHATSPLLMENCTGFDGLEFDDEPDFFVRAMDSSILAEDNDNAY